MHILLDSNIVIYSSQTYYNKLRDKLNENYGEFAVSAISIIEVLGYHKITGSDQELFKLFFNEIPIFSIDELVIEKAVDLRQMVNIGLGDSIIAATALINNFELWTSNTDDFKNVAGLKLLSPIK